MNAQSSGFRISDDILSEMRTFILKSDSSEYHFKIVYPKNYSKDSIYTAVLGLSGGNSDEQSVNYSYLSLFRSSYFDSRFIIMPMLEQPLQKLTANQMDEILYLLIKELKLSEENWLLVGTSNGGVATFRFAYIRPDLFSGIIAVPGALSFEDVHPSWKDYRILLACGENDTNSWKQAQKRDYNLLSSQVQNVFTYIISGEGHIISPKYNQDLIYDLFFNPDIR